MTTAQIHRIVFLHGLIKGSTGVMPHRTKEYEQGRTVGLDEIRYRNGAKSMSQRVKIVYRDVMMNGI